MPRPVEWTAIEKLLLDEATSGLATFAAEHPGEVFYGAVLDVEPYDGCSVSLHLNTEQHLTSEHDGRPVAADDLRSRFLPGAFGFTVPLTETDAFPAAAIEAQVERDLEDPDTDDDDPKTATFKLLEIACSVAFALEHGALTKLARTPDFTIAVTRDPREPGEVAVARYARFKKQLRARRRSDPALIPKPKSGV
jgi:hypothetical protein